jgi:uncharacterized membrane protein (DUF485 family)
VKDGRNGRTVRPRKPALGFIFVTLVLLMLGVGIIIPVLPGLVTQFKGGSIAEGSSSYGWLVGVFAAMQFVVARSSARSRTATAAGR